MIVSGALIHSNIFGGWPAVFYVMGGVSILWFVLWTVLMYDSPEEDPRISKEELHYIQASIGNQKPKVFKRVLYFEFWRKPPQRSTVSHNGNTG